MSTFRSFEEIDAWRLARILARQIYIESGRAIGARDFSLQDQMRKSAVSIMANIAEGFERSGTKEFIQFLSLAKGSTGELKSHLFISYDLGYFDKRMFLNLTSQTNVVAAKIGALIQYLRKSSFRGSKFQSSHKAIQPTRNP